MVGEFEIEACGDIKDPYEKKDGSGTQSVYNDHCDG